MIGAPALDSGWEWTHTPPDLAATPDALPPDLPWHPARVPGTVAQTMRDAGLWRDGAPPPLDDEDHWYRLCLTGDGPEVLRFEGLATIAEAWLDGARILASANMFLAQEAAVTLRGAATLHLCFRSLSRWLGRQRGRARWRPRMISPPTLRFARTTMLGRMPGWCPPVPPVGPWRPVLRLARGGVRRADLRPTVAGREGRVAARIALDGPLPADAWLRVGEARARLRPDGDALAGELVLPEVARWWPHTHGRPHLYDATLRHDGAEIRLGRIGFRDIVAETGPDGRGFALRVNGVRVFCRGACWTTPDLVSLPGGRDDYAPWLRAAATAGMNMIRVGGTMAYETAPFFALCDELGLLVWQDAMLANFDYPEAEPGFRTSLEAEVTQFLARTAAHPSLAVFCGGSEVMQQAAMLGAKRAAWDSPLYTGFLPAIVRRTRPDLVYVANSPSGGDLPFLPDEGVAHYYGVGAYLRPLDDARRAGVRFASECLAFANIPCAQTLAEALPVASTTDPRWKRAVPRDAGAPWDFEDVRDHYVEQILGQNVLRLRAEDFGRYLEVSRAVGCLLMEGVFAEWRRPGSACAGGLVWQLQDVQPGAGWGVLDSLGRPKPVWHALRQAFRPRQVILTDEGLSGLAVHVLNESPAKLRAVLRLICLRDGTLPVRSAEREVALAPHDAITLGSAALLGEFFDITYAYRFGPPAHDATMALLLDAADGSLIADAFHFPGGPLLPVRECGLTAAAARDGEGWVLRLAAAALAQYVHVEDPHFRAEEEWFHLPPGMERRIRLVPLADPAALPGGEVRALNQKTPARYRGEA